MDYIEKLSSIVIDPWSIVAIILIAFVIFITLSVYIYSNAKILILFYIVITLLSGCVIFFLNVPYGGVLMIVIQALLIVSTIALFSTEIKRAIWNGGKFTKQKKGRFDADEAIEEIIRAIQNMSKNDVGALIILSNGNLPTSVLESGVMLNATISSQLIESIFFPKSALHDGAMVLSGNNIQAAGCFLPIAQATNLSKDLGSRHRAGIGLTETVNVTAIIVSEETGIISIAKGGRIVRYVDTSILRDTLKDFFWQEFIG